MLHYVRVSFSNEYCCQTFLIFSINEIKSKNLYYGSDTVHHCLIEITLLLANTKEIKKNMLTMCIMLYVCDNLNMFLILVVDDRN